MTAAVDNGPWSLWRHIRPCLGQLSIAGLAMILRAAVLVIAPWPLKYIVDTVLHNHPAPTWIRAILADPEHHRMLLLDLLTGATLLFGIADSALDYTGNRTFLDAGQQVVCAVRRELFGHLISLPPDFHRRRRAGELMTRLTDDVQRLQEYIAMIGTGVLPHGLTILGMLVVMLIVDWRYALAVGAMAPVLVWISAHWSALLRANLRRVRGNDGELWGTAQEMLGAVQLVQASGRQAHEEKRFADQANVSLASNLHASLTQAQFPPLVNLVISVGGGLLTWYGATRVLAGQISTGDLLVFIAYLRGMVTPARQIAKAAPVLSRAAIAMERIREIFAERPSVTNRPGVVAPAACLGLLTFENASFSYQPTRRTLTDISFHLEPGRTIALAGPSGAGKSTIAALATRFIDPEAGRITLDGRDLRNLPLSFVRRNVTLLAQEPLLLHGTVWENIAYARPGADRQAAEQAAMAAGVHDIIAALPHGYDQPVAERGATLSGGQRQCIAIARATLADSPVIILDEPTSSLDATTEHQIMAALKRLTERRATLIIAHRLSTIRAADQIIVLQNGVVAQTGTHSELMLRSGVYANLVAAQTATNKHSVVTPASVENWAVERAARGPDR